MTELSNNIWLKDRWKGGTLAIWIVIALILLVARMDAISALALADTDDNLRLAQVRALLGGQPWYDLIQYRLAPPNGANIHWSHLPDLPIAGLILLLDPLIGNAAAERWAVALAPMLPLAIGFFAIALIARRIVTPIAWPIALLTTLCAGILMPMWIPLRIDHHGWQLALLAVSLAGLVDSRAARGGVTSGIATALSLTIGLEMIAFLALVGAATALFWVRDRAENIRIAAYGASLGGGAAIGFALFASQANRMAVCDALSPVWLSAVAAAGALLVLLAVLPLQNWRVRLAVGALAGGTLAVGFALAWPHCLGRPEGVSAGLQALWLDNVSEARPLYQQEWRKALLIVALPISGLIGYALAVIQAWRSADKLAPMLALSTMALASVILLFWQVRTAPASQLLAIPGATILGMYVIPRWRASVHMLPRVFGSLAAVAVTTGLWAVIPIIAFPEQIEPDLIAAGDSLGCSSAAAFAPIVDLPDATILTPIDLAPRLIVMTGHNGIAGPYHRNGEAILDVFDGFRGDDARLRETISRYDVDYVLLCPGMSGEGYYGANDPASSFARLIDDDAPDGLEPHELPDNSSFKLWRVR